MGSEMFELCDTSHYFVFRRVELVSSTLKKKTTKPKEDYLLILSSLLYPLS